MSITYGTAGLLFPAISLLMLAYTNRFLGLASVARSLVERNRTQHRTTIDTQVSNLRTRLLLLRHTQALGVFSLFFCTITMLLLFLGLSEWAAKTFMLALLFMLGSLGLSLAEIYLSVRAINAELDDLSSDA